MKNLKYVFLIVVMSCGNKVLQATRDNLDNAVRKGILVELEKFLQDKVDLNGTNYKQDYNAIHVAAKYNQLEALEMILKAGADPNVNGSADTAATHLAITHGHIECTQMLIKYGANINAADSSGNTLLHFASIYGRRDIAKMLLKSKETNFNLKNKDGKTALELAKEDGKKDIEKLF